MHPGVLRLGVAAESNLRWAAVDLAAPLEEARGRCDLSPVAAVALGRSLVAAALLQRFSSKNPGRLLLEISGDGELGKIHAQVTSSGYVRGLVANPQLVSPDGNPSSLAAVVGKGIFKVTRIDDNGKRYESQVELMSGEIGKDLVHYLEQSQQIRSAALLGVLPKPEGIVQAGGVLIEAFPGVEEEVLERLERNLTSMQGVSACLDKGGLEGLLTACLEGFDCEELERHDLSYGCGQGREDIRSKLVHLSGDDLDEVVDGEGFFTADCAFCRRCFKFSRDELAQIN
jgi:molecular chaperone Hsp33